MGELRTAFDERLAEIETYITFLYNLDAELRAGGVPRFARTAAAITTDQLQILYSSVYLQLYNLVEATISRCLDAVCEAAVANDRWKPDDLSLEMRREWTRYTARTHVELTMQNRLDRAVELVGHLVEALPVRQLKVETSGGSWDDGMIERVARRIGLDLRFTPEAHSGIKRHLRDDHGALALIALLRNDLAHGSLSFAECGKGVLVDELRDLKDRTALYLGEVVQAFEAWVASYGYLTPERRPA